MPEIKGYRELTPEELALINAIKEHEASTAALMERVHERLSGQLEAALNLQDKPELARYDQAQPHRWASMARTDFQTAYMKLVRAVAQPESPL